MTSSLSAILQNQAGPAFTREASVALDEHEYGAHRTLDAAITAILYALGRNANDSGVMAEVAKLIGERTNDSNILNNVPGLLSAVGQTSVSLGERLLALIFGARADAVGGAIARASGVGHHAGTTMLPIAGAMVLAQFAKKLGPGVPPTTAVSGLCAAEQKTLARVVPPYLRNLIAPVREGGTKAASGLTAAPEIASLAWLILPLVLLLGLTWIFLDPMSDEDATRQASRAPTQSDSKSPVRREDSTTTRPRGTDDWSFDRSPSRTSDAEQPSGATKTSKLKDPPLEGLVRMQLPDGNEIDVVPDGLEPRMIGFINDRYAPIDKAKWFDFSRVRFMSGSQALTFGSRAQLRKIVAIMKAYPRVNLKIGGYTDNVGDPAANLRLSEARAKSVVAELIRLGVSADRLEAEGYGDQHPIAENTTADGRAKNRRTAVSIRAK